MTSATLFGLCGAALVGLGLYGLVVHPQALRKILAFNLLGGGVFVIFGVIARRGSIEGVGDAVPHAMVITGIVVAFSATALAVALAVQLALGTDHSKLPAESSKPDASRSGH